MIRHLASIVLSGALSLSASTSIVWGEVLTFALPGNSVMLHEQVSELDSYALPIGAFENGVLPVLPLEGLVQRKSWRIGVQALTSLQVLSPLREQLDAGGYDVLFECDTQQCGGYDFRFETEVLQAPAMHVDLGDYRFISAQKGDDEHLSLLVSRSANAGFVQMIWVHTSIRDQAGQAVQGPSASAAVREGVASSDVSVTQQDHAEGTVRVLQTAGHVVLDDLAFETGSADLGAGPYKSLLQLSAFLNANAGKRVALVGHTDAVGTLERNINLSKRRAASVRERMISSYGVRPAQISAEGMGYLAPRAPNQTEDGRRDNRRVEAILLNTE